MKKVYILMVWVVSVFSGFSESVTNDLDVQNGIIYGYGFVNSGDLGQAFTNEGVRDVLVSAGQLCGIDPETGSVITNNLNLLPVVVQSLIAVSNIMVSGCFEGDGSGLFNLPAAGLSGVLPVSVLPTSGIWDAGDMVITNATFEGATSVCMDITSNLVVQGMISGDGSGLVNLAASGGEGELQFNRNGTLTGNTNYFIHPVANELAIRSQDRNIFSAYNDEDISDTNLIYALSNEYGTPVLRLRKDGADRLVFSGDGSITFGGETRTNWPSAGSLTYVPQQGDISMGVYTNSQY